MPKKRHYSCPQGTGSSMLPDPTERNVTGIGTVKKLVLALTIHDQKITMIKPARAGITIRTLAFPFEGRTGTKTHRHHELHLHTLPKKRLVITVPSYPRFLFPDKGSGSQQSARLPQRTTASSGVREPSTVWRAEATTALQLAARQLRLVVRSSLFPVSSCRES